MEQGLDALRSAFCVSRAARLVASQGGLRQLRIDEGQHVALLDGAVEIDVDLLIGPEVKAPTETVRHRLDRAGRVDDGLHAAAQYRRGHVPRHGARRSHQDLAREPARATPPTSTPRIRIHFSNLRTLSPHLLLWGYKRPDSAALLLHPHEAN